jgi:hypothetical protein
MSLHDLPTELDDHVISYLDSAGVSSISRVDKYYRKLADPHLYENPNFDDDHPRRLKQLLRTLLCRKDLHGHLIKDIRLDLHHDEGDTRQVPATPHDRQNTAVALDPQGDVLYQDLQSLIIQINVLSLRSRGPSFRSNSRWRGSERSSSPTGCLAAL